ncbi:ABC transporter substrate-binding protein [Dactylosporangium sp. NPDC005572]|uniref:ABC transporter substrate-binding protein n=1 Tax=Dactylosporangium sp. NPDC005572 TaxID=3156889 RepID=UPI0033BE0A45
MVRRYCSLPVIRAAADVAAPCGAAECDASGASATDPKADVIHVDMQTAFTGLSSDAGTARASRFKANFEMVDASGGFAGYRVVVDTADDQLNASSAPAAARKLAESDRVCIPGATASPTLAGIVPDPKAPNVLAIPGSGSTTPATDPQSTFRMVRFSTSNVLPDRSAAGEYRTWMARIGTGCSPDQAQIVGIRDKPRLSVQGFQVTPAMS